MLSKFKLLKNNQGLSGRLIKGSIGASAIKIVNLILTLFLAIILARLLGPEQFGNYSFIISLAMLLCLPVKAGIPKLLIREVAKYQLYNQWSELKGIVRCSHLFVLIFSILIILTSYYVIENIWLYEAAYKNNIFIIALVIMLILSLNNIRASVLKGLKYVLLGSFPEEIVRPAVSVSILLIVLIMNLELKLYDAMLINIFSTSIAFLVGTYFFIKYIPREVKNASKKYETKKWLQSLLPFTMLSVVIIVNGQIATVLLGVMSTSAEVGYFSISLKGAVLLSFALTAINMVTAPYITKLHYSNEKIKLQKIVTLSTRVAFIFCLFIALIFLIFGKDIISFLFGKVYVPSYLALVIISVGHLVNVACGPTGLVLNMTGFEKYSLRGVFFGLISNLLISFALIPLYGLIGASLAVMTSLIVTNIVQVISAQKKVGICTHIFCTFKSNNPYEK